MKNKIVISVDNKTEMRKIEVNGKIIMEGNFWDFPLDETIREIAKSLKIDFKTKSYSYEK